MMSKSDGMIAAKGYCEKNNLSLEKLDIQSIFLIYEEIIFAQPTSFKGDGLRDDLKSQPIPTLIINRETGKVSETEHTAKYLA